MKKKDNKKKLVILLLLVVSISIGYAALTTTLNINGNTKIEKASWDIHFENLIKSEDSVTATTEASIDSTKTLIEYTVMLAEPGDFYEFTVDIVNAGSIDAMISEVLKEGLTTNQEKYIEYIATYADGTDLQEKDPLYAGERENIIVRVKYRDDITAEELPTEETTLSLKFQVIYVQLDKAEEESEYSYVCKRATALHTEECTQTDSSLYCSGAGYTTTGTKGTTITYGNLGTIGTFTNGDAFDCDVNGDGTYDSSTERFYYVTDLDTDNSYAVLIYNNNVSSGVLSNSATFAFNTVDTSYLGPQATILQQLPTTSQWKNVSLVSTDRSIKDEAGTVRVNSISYAGYAARLLTYQEIDTYCGLTGSNQTNTGDLDNCNYLLENTNYSSSVNVPVGFWLESVYSFATAPAWAVTGNYRSVMLASVNLTDFFGVRPVIEVPKSNILY